MKIQISTPTAKYLPLEIEASTTIAELRQLLYAQYKIPVDQYNYTFCGRTLYDHQQLWDYNIQSGSTIHQGLGISGGFINPKPEKCSICIQPLIHAIGTYKCKKYQKENVFHTSCVNTWFSVSKRCPICRDHNETDENVNSQPTVSKEKEEVDLPDVDKCTVCMTKQIDVVLIPCGHMCVCKDCSLLICKNDDRCPICRRTIVQVIKTFRS